jgi:hypothetical protein
LQCSVREYGRDPYSHLSAYHAGRSILCGFSRLLFARHGPYRVVNRKLIFRFRVSNNAQDSVHGIAPSLVMANTSTSLTSQILISVALAAGLSINALALLALS